MRCEQASKDTQKAQHQVEILQMEKEELVKQHTIETGDLRKKNNYLMNQCQKLEQMIEAGASAAPGSATYGDEFDELDDLEGNFFSTPFNNEFDMRMDTPIKKEKTEDTKAPAPGLLLIVSLKHSIVVGILTKVSSFFCVVLSLLLPRLQARRFHHSHNQSAALPSVSSTPSSKMLEFSNRTTKAVLWVLLLSMPPLIGCPPATMVAPRWLASTLLPLTP